MKSSLSMALMRTSSWTPWASSSSPMIAKLAQLVGGLSEGERAGEIQDRHIAHDTLYDDHLTTPAPLDLERTSLLSLWFAYCRSPSDNFGMVRDP